ncbi:MAG: ATP-binding cassette domain-containing protein [Puniceicoccales bacterium]|jgi:phospholipid/cholesterol/gamma-HCH transport system ATP-binding protein|nr:ATP-binding cassette domain-containing protein [Puniceicoccales bacterium]
MSKAEERTPAHTLPFLQVKDLETRYGERVVMRHISFELQAGEICLIIGGSGCGKSTLLRYLIGLLPSEAGHIFYQGIDFALADGPQHEQMVQQFGVLFQGGALWSDMSLAENVALPLQRHTSLPPDTIADIVSLKLALVGLEKSQHLYPSEISGGMRKLAGLARAMALDPRILFFDEPSAGLDPISARHLDELILNVNRSFGTTLVIVTHDLESIFKINGRVLFLDAETQSVLADGPARELREHAPQEKIRQFLRFHSDGAPIHQR